MEEQLDRKVLADGTLVQVKEECTDTASDYDYSITNARAVTEHGWLFLIAGVEDTNRDEGVLYTCRSLATGAYESFFDCELNVMEASDG